MKWHAEYEAGGKVMEPIYVGADASSPAAEPPAARGSTEPPRATGRFADEEFGNMWSSWSAFWDKMHVPEAKVPNVKARLGHLFALAAGQPATREQSSAAPALQRQLPSGMPLCSAYLASCFGPIQFWCCL